MDLQFRHEYERRLRVAVVGCGGHAYRNILPALNYLPVDLLATCDIDSARAEAYARTFGAGRAFGSFDDLLAWAPPAGVEALLLVLRLRDGLPSTATSHPGEERGLHVWMEKPPARDGRRGGGDAGHASAARGGWCRWATSTTSSPPWPRRGS